MNTKLSELEWKQFAAESGYRTDKLASLLGLSRRQLERIIRRDFGSTPHSWLGERRLREAGDMLLAGRRVHKVSAELCYRQPSHFCRRFKEFYGIKPSQFVAGNQKIKMSQLDNECRV